MKTKITGIFSLCASLLMIAVIFTGTVQAPLPYYGTYIGGNNPDIARGIAVCTTYAVITGWTNSTDFPTTIGAFDRTYNGGVSDAFVTRPQNLTSSYPYSTYIGGNETDIGYGIAVDSNGNAYIIGVTNSTNFPVTPNVYDNSYNGGGDVFVAKLNATGTTVIYCTYLGGSGYDCGRGIAVDSSCNAYITGYTNSTDFPTPPGANDTTYNGGSLDVFIAKLNSTGNLVYSTYLGGTDRDGADAIAIDSSGNAYVTGFTWSDDFPTTTGAYDTSLGGNSDAFVTKLNATGSTLLYSTYFGGDVYEHAHGIAVDSNDNAYITGQTDSDQNNNFPLKNAYDSTYNGDPWDAFVAKLTANGDNYDYSSYLGGNDSDKGTAIALDSSRNAYITGLTQSSNFPTTHTGYDTSLGGTQDAFVSKLNLSLANRGLLYSSYLGGDNGTEIGFGIGVDSNGHAYVAGCTTSDDFPTSADAMDQTYNDDNDEEDAFASRLST
jgi:hypothetical protein